MLRRNSTSSLPRNTARGLRIPVRGFSLVEVLMAVFILGIGVISVAALFPAGIAQQRRSNDETMGPIVANSALSLLRAKLLETDFGHEYDNNQVVDGDFGWYRPAFYFDDEPSTGATKGAINIFRELTTANIGSASEVPWNTDLYGAVPPEVIIFAHERYYPQVSTPLSGAASADRPKPQYVWDCMFRRFQGRIHVAIFVYRVTMPGGGQTMPYAAQPQPVLPDVPPIPCTINLKTPVGSQTPYYCHNGEWRIDGPPGGLDPSTSADDFVSTDDAFVHGTKAGTVYNPADPGTPNSGGYPQAWQEPGQWILDQNNNIYRVLSRRRTNLGLPVEVELVRPVPQVPIISEGAGQSVFDLPDDDRFDVVTRIWYVPVSVRVDVNGDGTPEESVTWSLTPVFATVKEL